MSDRNIEVASAGREDGGKRPSPIDDSWLADVLSSIADAVLVADLAGRIRFANPAATTLTGWEQTAVVGKRLSDVLSIVDEETGAPPAEDLVLRVVRDGDLFPFASRFTLIRRDGARLPINGNIAPVRDEMGVITGAVAIFRDISDRKRVERTLRESEKKFRLVFENAFEGINLYEEDLEHGTRRLIDCNERYAEMAGRSREELLEMGDVSSLQRKVGPVVPDEDNLTLRRKHIPYRGLISWIRPDGKENIIEYTAVPVEMDGRPFTIGLDRDITDRVEMQRALERRAQELEVLAEDLRRQTAALQARNEELDAFAHSVAHDLRNPLAVIFSLADFLSEEYKDLLPADVQGHLDAIHRGAQKMNGIISGLLLLAEIRKRDVELTPLDMQSIVESALGQLTYMIQEHKPEIVLPPAWPAVLGYGPWVEEVWVNYISNAIRYGGRPARVELGATPQGDGTVRFWVRDNGPGLTPEEQSRLFAPFTRLAQMCAEGHGLGLSIVRRIMDKLGGEVGVESEPGRGSVFSFTLPVADGT
ncbi:MAG: PAS domain S-box protein [Anaerolineae bacterium]|nr:PAS domain S-box protein [Anaerolineae bacterium]